MPQPPPRRSFMGFQRLCGLALAVFSTGCASVQSLLADGQPSRALERVDDEEGFQQLILALERDQMVRVGVHLVSRDELLAEMRELSKKVAPEYRRTDEALTAKADAVMAEGPIGVAFAVMRTDDWRHIELQLKSHDLTDYPGASRREIIAAMTSEEPPWCGPKWTLFRVGAPRTICEDHEGWITRAPTLSALERLVSPHALGGHGRWGSSDGADAEIFRESSPEARLLAMRVCWEARGYYGRANAVFRYEIPLGKLSPSRVAERFNNGWLPIEKAGGRRSVTLVNENGSFSDPPRPGPLPLHCRAER